LDATAWPKTFSLAFNISPVQLRDSALGERIISLLEQTGFSPRRLEIEITESAFVERNGAAKTVIDELRQAGVPASRSMISEQVMLRLASCFRFVLTRSRSIAASCRISTTALTAG
ncbi:MULTISPECIES: EAL domain-containing protein, partial [unclassified Bradyrhizobium]|uniref:EAL domain-containing protein n=1 Tax=unclassified Bradyrhizobium TaxID=2631580 RepID=UPI0023EE4F22